MTNDELVSAFIDGEPVDPALLADALADPGGRQCLLDLLSLRRLVVEAEAEVYGEATKPVRKAPRVWLLAAAAAAAVLVGFGAFTAGRQIAEPAVPSSVSVSQEPPAPDRVIELREGIEWQKTVGGI